jgi:uncharacterized membrane protein
MWEGFMAGKKPTSLEMIQSRAHEVLQEKERREREIESLGKKLRALHPDDAKGNELRSKLRSLREGMGGISDEYASLARTVSSMQGGTNHVAPR